MITLTCPCPYNMRQESEKPTIIFVHPLLVGNRIEKTKKEKTENVLNAEPLRNSRGWKARDSRPALSSSRDPVTGI